MTHKTALVLRATGVQGRAVTRHLTSHGWNVHAFVSDATTDRAVAVQKISDRVTLYSGTLADANSIEIAIRGCNALFLNQMPSFTDPDSETREASTVLTLAKAAGVTHIVHSTTLSLNDSDVQTKVLGNLAAFAILKKGEVEGLVRASGIPWTIIRGGYFMTNLTMPFAPIMFPGIQEGTFTSSYRPETILPLVDPDDIGAFVAAALNEPSKFESKIVNVAGEKMRVEDVVKEISRAAGQEIKAVYRSAEETEKAQQNNPLVAGQKLSLDMEKYVDIEEVQGWGVPLTDFKTFLERNRDIIVP